MRLLAIPGSLRAQSTNRAFLSALAELAPAGMELVLWEGLGDLPIFSPDLEADPPAPVRAWAAEVARADGLLFAVPEYAHALPGGLKNAIDWLVSRPEIIGKPAALVQGSQRGEEALAQLRRVLETVTEGFAPDLFFRLHLLSKTPEEVRAAVHAEAPAARLFLEALQARLTRAAAAPGPG